MPNYSGIWTEQAVMQANGAGNWPNAPGAPTIGTATNTGAGGTVSVAFTAPTFAGIPATITSYTVTSSPGGLTGTGASSPITVSGLTNGTAYTFTVQATNANGTGPASAASNSVTPTLVVYVEDVMSTYLYTGTGAALTITNGIDLAGKGGMVWIKSRSAATNHALADSTMNLAAFDCLIPNATNAKAGNGDLNAFNSNGFSLGYYAGSGNASGSTYASWSFREQAKFFDVVTWSGTSSGASTRAIPHNLGSTPGFIVVKVLNATSDWVCNHRSLGSNTILLNSTSASSAVGDWGTIDSSVFTVTNVGNGLNFLGQNYVAYLFAHDAGGFGLTGTDNVISCGSKTLVGSGVETVNVGYEPQWVLWKLASASGNWHIVDVMRGMSQTSAAFLNPNSSGAEGVASGAPYFTATSTGFSTESYFGAGDYIYITIRRGPMKVPTSGTSVYGAVAYSGDGTTGRKLNYGFSPDLALYQQREGNASYMNMFIDRLRGDTRQIQSWTSAAEGGFGNATVGVHLTTGPSKTIDIGVNGSYINASGSTYIMQGFGRAPGFFDEVCYTGNGSSNTLTHNLSVAPELVIIKSRNNAYDWQGGSNFTGSNFVYSQISSTSAGTTFAYSAGVVFSAQPTSTSVFLNSSGGSNSSGATYVAYLFATCAGVSKVGSYTGTGAAQTINCGFTGGSRFVLIKRTDSTGDWYVWDSARGIIAGNDPYLLLNSTAAEVTNTDYVDTAATGFEISSTAPAAINANGGTFIFLAIA